MKKTSTAAFIFSATAFLFAIGLAAFYYGPGKLFLDRDVKKDVAGVYAEALEEKLPVISLKPSFYDESLLDKSISENQSIEKDDRIRAIISPHHFLAASLISSALSQASGRKIENIIIVGPNHDSIGNETFSTTKASWQTPFGNLETDPELVGKFMSEMGVFQNLPAFENEHAIGSLAILAKNYFPEARLLPILISSSAKKKDAEILASWLSKNVGENDLVVFSMDFSHYLTEAKADESDRYTKSLIMERDIDRICELDDDFVDSPIGLATSLLFAGENGLKSEIIDNANSFDLSSVKSDSTTSYFTIKFVR